MADPANLQCPTFWNVSLLSSQTLQSVENPHSLVSQQCVDLVFGAELQLLEHDVVSNRIQIGPTLPVMQRFPALGDVSLYVGQTVTTQKWVENRTKTITKTSADLSVSVEYSAKVFDSYLTVIPKVSRGAQWFDDPVISDRTALYSTPIDKEEVTLNYDYPLSTDINYSTHVYAIWSSDEINPVKGVSVNNSYTVSGFEFVHASSNEGYFWRNNLAFDVGKLARSNIVRAALSLDMGQVGENKIYSLANETVVGAAVRLGLYDKDYFTVLSVGVPVDHPQHYYSDNYTLMYWLSFSL
ncbi:hypothetical protein F9817_19715 [Vibrio sp. CAIM 722]|uniref:Haemolysin activator HlyB C-terminal domain-containing protein n=1 Tax=Vibrio eleionomae TaxID=2653505 RepID=A0A7X4RWJ2_9VIBR|nr:ShlB/FhaC/HecB family hemolysin secretion/activation protein [Vibrio eleionomae]MZI95407.1 hypothetical protein [Vibrio eleionomae]